MLLQITCPLFQKSKKKKNMPKINLDPDYSLANSKKIKKFVKTSIQHNFDSGLKETIKWIKNYI